MRLTWSPKISIPLGRRFARSRWLGAVGDERRRKRQLAAEISIVQGSSLFDCEWYLRTYPDVAQAGRDPLVHYLEIGWREGRDPGPHFGTSAYLKANADVARSAINPLVHFIEFGRAEGRGSVNPRRLTADRHRAPFDFPLAAPCASFRLPADKPARWLPSHSLDGDRKDALICGSWVAGYAPGADIRTAFTSAFDLLAEISGFAAAGSLQGQLLSLDSGDDPADAWYVNLNQLRTRWISRDYPFVVRGFQCDPLRTGEFTLVGEGRIGSQIDFVDVNMKNRFFPLLFVLAEPGGRLRGSRLLAFPSLCRGGIHYGELLSSAAKDRSVGTDPFTLSDRLSADMLKLRRPELTPAVSNVVIDLDKADGNNPLFQADFQEWLRTVVRVSMAPAGASDRNEFLAAAEPWSEAGGKNGRGDTLFLDDDTIPTIAALTAPRDQDSQKSVNQVHLLVAAQEPCKPVISIRGPDLTSSFGEWSSARSPKNGAVGAAVPATIRVARSRGLADSELFMPTVDETGEDTAHRLPVTWLIDPRGWDQHLGHAMSCIERQAGGGADIVAFTHRLLADTRATVKAASRHVTLFKDLDTALADISTPLAAFVGRNVLMHNRLTAAYLARLLENDAVSTASCVIVSAEKIGSAWHAAILDQGTVSMEPMPHQDQDLTRLAEQMWRADYAISEPSPYLWCTRSSLLAEWMASGHGGSRSPLHLCTARISASHVGRAERTRPLAFVPRAAANTVTRVELLLG